MSEFITDELYSFLKGFRTIDGGALNHNFELLNKNIDDLNIYAVYLGGWPDDASAEAFSASKDTPLSDGQMYFNETVEKLRIYDNGVWVNYDAASQAAAAAAMAAAAAAAQSLVDVNAAAAAALVSIANAVSAGVTTLNITTTNAIALINAAAEIYPNTAAGIAATTNLEYFQVPSANSNEYTILYQNQAGVAVEIKRYPSISGARALAVNENVLAIKSAISSTASLKLLLLAGIGVSEYAPNVMLSWADQSGNGLTAVLPGTLFSGADPRPVITTSGIYFNGEAGLNIASGVLAKTDNFAIHFPFQMSVTPGQSYADVAAMTAGSATQCDIAQVTGGPNTIFVPDIDYTMQGNYTEAQLLKGYYKRQQGGTWVSLTTLYTFNSPSGYYLRLSVNRFGQPFFLLNGPGGQTIVFATGKGFPYNASVLDGLPHLISIWRDSQTTSLRMFLDGQEVGAEAITSGNITDLNILYINGAARSGNPLIPVNGVRHTNWGMKVVDNCDWKTFQNSYNAMAQAVGTPLCNPPKYWNVIFITGQSLAQGSIDTSTDTWVNPNGWNGMITRQNPTNSGEHVVINRSYLKNVYANKVTGIINPNLIGPVALQTNSSGTGAGGYGGGGGVETVFYAGMQQVLAASTNPDLGFLFVHIQGAGSYALLTGRSTPPYLVQNVKGVPQASLTQYEFLMQQMAWVHDFLQLRGWEAASVDWWDQQGFAQPSGAQVITFYDQVNPDIKRLFNVTVDCGFYMPQVNVANNVNNNSASIAIDQTVIDALDFRGTRPIYGVYAPYVYSNHIHYYRAMYLWAGEHFGNKYTRVKFNGENWQPVRPKQFIIAGNTIKIQFYLATGRQLQFKTNANNIDSILQTGGWNTYGFSYVGGGLTFAADVALATTTTTNDSVLLTFSGPPGLAGHILSYIEATRYGNLFDDDPTAPINYDQDWTVPIVGGQPVFKNGLLFDLNNPAWAFKKVF